VFWGGGAENPGTLENALSATSLTSNEAYSVMKQELFKMQTRQVVKRRHTEAPSYDFDGAFAAEYDDEYISPEKPADADEGPLKTPSMKRRDLGLRGGHGRHGRGHIGRGGRGGKPGRGRGRG